VRAIHLQEFKLFVQKRKWCPNPQEYIIPFKIEIYNNGHFEYSLCFLANQN